MPLILPANTLSAEAYSVANSCRFNDDDSAYMHITRGSAGNQKTFTISMWLKRGKTGSSTVYFFASGPDNNSSFSMHFDSDQLEVWEYKSSAYQFRLKPKYKFRDVSAWYHVVVAVDTTQGTDTNRVKFYINGTQYTEFDTTNWPSEDYDTYVNDDAKHWLGKYTDQSTYYDGYLAEVVVLDGTAASPTSFGEFDSDSPTIWKPIDVSGLTFGTNGFYLDFEASDNLGNDANGGTDWTETNLDATDQCQDSPTNNFCTMNPLDNYYAPSTFAEGNCHITTATSSNSYSVVTGTMGVSAGKWYWEVELDAGGTPPYAMLGITDIPTLAAAQQLGYGPYQWAIRQDNAMYVNDNTNSSAWGVVYAVNDIIMFALDLTDNKLYFGKDGDWMQASGGTGGDPTDGTGAISITDPASNQSGFYFPAVSEWGNANATLKCNFGGCSAFAVSSGNADDNGYGDFEFDVPSGYYALCSKNLAEFG